MYTTLRTSFSESSQFTLETMKLVLFVNLVFNLFDIHHAFMMNTPGTWGRTSLHMASIIDLDSVVKTDATMTALSDGLVPGELSVKKTYDVGIPSDMSVLQQKIFEFGAKSKVVHHQHEASGQYFVTSGSITAKTKAGAKEYKKGDMFIVPLSTEYEFESDGGTSIYYIYWQAERPY